MTLPDAPYAPAPVGADADGPAAAGGAGPVTRALDTALRAAGGLVCVLAALLTGLVEIALVALRVGGTLVGVAVPLAVVANVALAWFARHSVGTIWAAGLPWLAWTALMFLAAGTRTTEGDHLIAGDNWVALPMILLGSVAFAGYVYRQIMAGAPGR